MSRNSMFTSWKVPSRLTTGSERAETRATSRQSAVSQAKGDEYMGILPEISEASPRPSTRAMSRPGTKASASRQQMALTARAIEHPTSDKETKARNLMAGFKYSSPQAHPVDQETEAADQRMVERVMRQMAARNRPSDNDIKHTVNSWMHGATETDRAAALDFFKNLVDAPNGGTDGRKAQQVVNALSKSNNGGMASMARGGATSASQQREMRHLRLLTPNTRANREMHQSWHHLPNYVNPNRVQNKTSVYVSPHASIPRHFSIHPDWGMT